MRSVLVCFEKNVSIALYFLQLSWTVRYKYLTLLVIMASPSTRCALAEFEQVQILNEVLENGSGGEYNLDNDKCF
jgi:hypothetical protein